MNRDLFLQKLSEHEREFFLRIDELMECEEVVVHYNENSVTYFPDTKLKQQPVVLRYTVKNGELMVELKLNFIDCYTDLIEKMPENIKEMFRSIRHCSRSQKICDRSWHDGSPKCGLRRTYTLDGKHYYLCSWQYYFNPDISKFDDAEYYTKIIHAEVQMAKSRKKHNTLYYDEQEENRENKERKEPPTEDTVIGSRKISAVEFRKFFKKTLGEDYEKHAVVWDVIKMSMNYKGKTLKEIIGECLNPPGSKNMEEILSERRFNNISESDKSFIIAFNKAMNEMGYDFGDAISFGLDIGMTIKYGKTGTKTRPCPAHIEIGRSGIALTLRLFLTKIDAHQQYIESAPAHIKNIFISTHGDCDSCNINFCSPKTYTIDGRLIRKCKHSTFYINNPSVENLPDYMGLLAEFYPIKKPKPPK